MLYQLRYLHSNQGILFDSKKLKFEFILNVLE